MYLIDERRLAQLAWRMVTRGNLSPAELEEYDRLAAASFAGREPFQCAANKIPRPRRRKGGKAPADGTPPPDAK